MRLDDADNALEYDALLLQYGRVQQRCSDLVAAQARRIAALEAQVLRLHAQHIISQTQLACAHDAQTDLLRRAPDLPKRFTLARQVQALLDKVGVLMREKQARQLKLPGADSAAAVADPSATTRPATRVFWAAAARDAPAIKKTIPLDHQQQVLPASHLPSDDAALESSLAAADLVICQVGCISHQAYWRVQDHCKRTGKTCVLVNSTPADGAALQADALSVTGQ